MEAFFVVGSSPETSGELAGRLASIRLARQPYQSTARADNSCFFSIERLSHNMLELAVMAKVVNG